MLMRSRSTVLLAAASAMAVGIGLGAASAWATPTTGFSQTGPGPYDYNTAANWVGGTINGVWDSSLTLTTNQTVTMSSTPATSTGLSFAYTGADNLTLEAITNPVTFDLLAGAGITDNVGGYHGVTIGGGSKALNIDLGGGTQALTGASGSNLTINATLTDGSVTVAGLGLVYLNGANTYTGATTVTNTGKLLVGILANGGVASSIGESSNAAANLILGTGQFLYSGTSAASTDRLFTIGGASATIGSDTATLTYSNTGAVAFSVANQAETLSFTGGGPMVFDPLIGNNGTKATSVNISTNVSPASMVTLANTGNSYTGATTMNYGKGATLIVTSLADGNAVSSIGASSNAASNLTFTANSTLEYVGTGSTTNRNFTVLYNEAVAGAEPNTSFTINSSGAGALVMSGAETFGATGTVATAPSGLSLVLDGTSSPSLVNEYNGVIADPVIISGTYAGTYAFAVTKSGTNTWALGGANTYTGATAVNGGTLLVTGSLASGSAVTVNTGGALGGNGTVGGTVSVAGGTLAAGLSGTGALNVGATSFAGASTMDVTLNGDAITLLNVTGNLDLGTATTLDVALSGTQTLGRYVFADYSGALTGTFLTVAGAPVGYTVDYSSPGQIALQKAAIPEPATLSLMSLAGLGILLLGRKRKTA